MTIQVYFKGGKSYETWAAPSIVSPQMLCGLAALSGAEYCVCLDAFGTRSFNAKDWKGGTK